MKKSLLALAALTAFAGAASAQSSVTLFGVVDINGRNVKNGAGGDITSLSTDGNASSRLGFRGVEDLGGGLRAGFWLEGGFDGSNGTFGGGNGGATANLPATGAVSTNGAVASPASNPQAATSSTFFNRRATVSLLGGFGEIRLGRDYTPTFWNHTVFDVFGTNGVGAATNLLLAANGSVLGIGHAQTGVRANNSFGYFLPSLGGVYGQFMVTANETQPNGNKYMGGRIGYGAGPVNVAVAYGITKDTTAAMLDDQKALNVGGSFNAGFLTVMGQYNEYKEGVRKLTNYGLGVAVPVGAGTIKASYAQSKVETGTTSPKANMIAVGYVYDLSKRTAVYVHASQIDNDAGLNWTVGGPGPGAIQGFTATGFKSSGYEVGVRHSF